MNCKMPDLKRSIETAGFTDVRTILASGNVAFDARASAQSTLERKAEAAMKDVLGRSFYTIVRSQAQLIEMLEADPFAKFKIPAKAKRVVTFLRERPTTKIKLPYRFEGVHIVALEDREIFTAYEPHPRGPIFMTLLERNFGKDITTRTWDTIKKCSAS
jgi:uncharacterized protein (DUF1697 family)